MPAGPASTADLEKLKRDLETRIGRLEQATQRAPAADPNVARISRSLEQLTTRVGAAERKIQENANKSENGIEHALAGTQEIIARIGRDVAALQRQVQQLQQQPQRH